MIYQNKILQLFYSKFKPKTDYFQIDHSTSESNCSYEQCKLKSGLRHDLISPSPILREYLFMNCFHYPHL